MLIFFYAHLFSLSLYVRGSNGGSESSFVILVDKTYQPKSKSAGISLLIFPSLIPVEACVHKTMFVASGLRRLLRTQPLTNLKRLKPTLAPRSRSIIHFAACRGVSTTSHSFNRVVIPVSDAFYETEDEMEAGNSNSQDTVIGLRGFFVGQKLNIAEFASSIAQQYPLFAQIQGRNNVIFALDEDYAEISDQGSVVLLLQLDLKLCL